MLLIVLSQLQGHCSLGHTQHDKHLAVGIDVEMRVLAAERVLRLQRSQQSRFPEVQVQDADKLFVRCILFRQVPAK